MNYEKTILEMMSRIQVLEDQVAELMKQKNDGKEVTGMTTKEIREYIIERKMDAKRNGQTTLVLRSGDIHKDLNLDKCMPPVCNAMYQCMVEGDRILHTTPSGKSSTIEIQYNL